MRRPRLLDLFAGAGGCSVGYHRAGFDVTGVDIEAHPDYPYELIVADAMEVLQDRDFLSSFEVVHASPPCPAFSTITPAARRDGHTDRLTPTRAALQTWGGTYVIENVPGAPMPTGVTFCGQAMGLPRVRRHRLFESNALIMSPGCGCSSQSPFGIYGDHGDLTPVLRTNGTSRGNKARDTAHAQQLLGIDWMTRWDDLADAIPPNYSEFIGLQLIDVLASGDGDYAGSSPERTPCTSAYPGRGTGCRQNTGGPGGNVSSVCSRQSAYEMSAVCSPESNTVRGGQG